MSLPAWNGYHADWRIAALQGLMLAEPRLSEEIALMALGGDRHKTDGRSRRGGLIPALPRFAGDFADCGLWHGLTGDGWRDLMNALFMAAGEGYSRLRGSGNFARAEARHAVTGAWFRTLGEQQREYKIKALAARDGSAGCAYCGKEGEMAIEHVTPQAKNGRTVFRNLVLACTPCNSSKGDRDLREWGLSRPDHMLSDRFRRALTGNGDALDPLGRAGPPPPAIDWSDITGAWKE